MKRSLGFESADEDEEVDADAVRARAGPSRVPWRVPGKKLRQTAGQDEQDEVDYLTIEIADDRASPQASRTREADVLRHAMPRGLRMMEKMGFRMGQKLGKEGNRNGLLSPLGGGGRAFSRETPLDEHAFSAFVQGMNLKSELRHTRRVLDGMRRVWLGLKQSPEPARLADGAEKAEPARLADGAEKAEPARLDDGPERAGWAEKAEPARLADGPGRAGWAEKAEPIEQSTAGPSPAGDESKQHSTPTDQSNPASIEHSEPTKHSSPAESEPAGEFNPSGPSEPAEKAESTQQSKAEPARSALRTAAAQIKQSEPTHNTSELTTSEAADQQPPQSPQTQLKELNQQIDTLNNQLRTEFNYCYFCGAQYESQHELAELCPGTKQSSHY